MLLTATTVLWFFIISILAVGIGYLIEKIELYTFGAVIMFIVSLLVIQGGIAEKIGVTTNSTESLDGNETTVSKTETFVYEQNEGVVSNTVGLIGVLISAGLMMSGFLDYKRKKKERANKLDVGDLPP